MINVPIKDYQFSGIISIIGFLLLISTMEEVSNDTADLITIIIFIMGTLMTVTGAIATTLMFFLGDNMRFKR